MAGILLCPMIVAFIYYIFFSIDRYVSIAQVAVRQAGSQESPQVPGLAIMMGAVNPASREETLYVREYILSADMLNVLQKELQWSKHYNEQLRDPLFWLSKKSSREDLLEYYRRMVSAHFDEQTGLLTVEVQSFSQPFAQQTLKTILNESERLVNELSHRMAREQMAFAQAELSNARSVYEDRRSAMLLFQSNNKVLDAEASAKARAEIISELESKLTMERTALKGLLATLSPDTPQVRQQKIKIRALEQQRDVENQRLVSEQTGDKLNVIAAEYRGLTIDTAIAEESYKLAMSAVESARIEANKKLRSLVTVVSPNVPDSAIYPERAYNLITIFLGLLLFYGIARFVVATVDDHRD